jgi:hypothetical protein
VELPVVLNGSAKIALTTPVVMSVAAHENRAIEVKRF